MDLYVKSMVGNTVTLAWTSEPGEQPVTDHVVQANRPGQGRVAAEVATGSVGQTFTFVAPTGVFEMRVRARSGAMSGAWSEPIALCVNTTCPAITPVNVLGLVNGADMALAWRNPLESGVPTKIVLQVAGSAEDSIELPGTAEGFAYDGVPGTSDSFRVTACTEGGCSAPTSPIRLEFPGPCSGMPSEPARFSASLAGRTIRLDWELPDSGPAPTNYILKLNGAFVGSLPTSARTVTAMVGAGVYEISVAGENACGRGAESAPVVVTVP